jgi:hypothetical protein
MTWHVTVDFNDETEARAFFALLCAARQDLVPLVWRGRGTDLKYAELHSATEISVQKAPPPITAE